MLCRADLGLAVAGLGGLTMVPGLSASGAASPWPSAWRGRWASCSVVQPHLGDGVSQLQAYAAYGDTPASMLWGMLTHPVDLFEQVFSRPNFQLLVYLFAPVLFLPFLSPRYLLPVVPLQVLYLAGDVIDGHPVRAAVRGHHRLHLPGHPTRAEPARAHERREGHHRPPGADHHGRGRRLVLRALRAQLDLRAAVGLGWPGRRRRRPLEAAESPSNRDERRCARRTSMLVQLAERASSTTSIWARAIVPTPTPWRRRGVWT